MELKVSIHSGIVAIAILYTLNPCAFGGADIDRLAALLVGQKYSISQAWEVIPALLAEARLLQDVSYFISVLTASLDVYYGVHMMKSYNNTFYRM